MGTTVIDAADMDATEIVAFVRTVPIFHTLSKDQLTQLAEAADVRTCDRGEVLAEPATLNIVTIEDPVEHSLEFATQIQVNRELGLDFPNILRTILRQDPDLVLVGEIRDAESAALALEAAMTGHLVLSSLHTYSALETLVRLQDLEVKPYLLASALKGVISQQLLPRLCPGCTEPLPSDAAVVTRLKTMGVLEADWSGVLCRGKDCEGFPPGGESGRVGAYEVMFVTDQLRDLIDRGARRSEFEKALDEQYFYSFPRYCRFLLKEGLVAPEQIERILPKKPMSFPGWPESAALDVEQDK